MITLDITMANDSDEADKEPMEEVAEEEDEDIEEDLVSEDAFWHIEASWLNGFEAGMNIEIEHTEKKFWPAQITSAISNLLSIRWSGAGADSWFDVKAKKCYPSGYLKDKSGYSLEPPEKVNIDDEAGLDVLDAYAKDQIKPTDEGKPLSLYLSGGLKVSDVFKPGIMLELSHRLDPDKHWFAQVRRNVGGRLLVRWVHSCEREPDTEKNNPVEFWIYYSHPRVHHLGYAKEKGNISYEPVFLYNTWVSDIAKYLSDLDNENILTAKYLLNLAKASRPPLVEPSSIRDCQVSDLALTFPSDLGKLVPVIIQSKGEDHLIVASQTKKMVACYPNDDNIILLPSSWAEENDFSLYNFKDATNDSNNYLIKNKANEAPVRLVDDDRIYKFKVNHKLQVVHPQDPNMICEGIVSRLTPPLVWVEVSSDLVTVLPYNSTDLYPSGFCEDNSYPLTKLLTTSSTKKPVKRRDESNSNRAFSEKSSEMRFSSNIPPSIVGRSRDICPRIYFNHKCFTGPLLSKSKIRELPRFVGPGPVVLVIQEVIAKIISVAYVPPRVLNEMSSRTFTDLLRRNKIRSARTTNFKAKYNKKAFRDEIVVVTDTKDVSEYCSIVCGHLKCCYHLFGPDLYDGDDCPSHCRGLRKTNKVLKRAIYYRQKAAKTKGPCDVTSSNSKSVGSPAGSSGTKEVESAENIEPDEATEEVKIKGGSRRSNKNETKESIRSGKASPVGRTITRKLSSLVEHKGEEDNSQDNSEKSAEDFVEEELKPEQNSFSKTNGDLGISDPVGRRGEKTYEKLIRPNKRKTEELIEESASSNGSDNSLDHGSQPNSHVTYEKRKLAPQKSKSLSEASLLALFDPNDRLNPINWSTKDVYNYFRKNRCNRLSETLIEHEIDGLALLLLDNKSEWMNLILGFSRNSNIEDVTRLSQVIQKLKSQHFPGASQNYIQLAINRVALQRQAHKV